MSRERLLRSAAVVAGVLVLAGCAGGGGGSASPDATTGGEALEPIVIGIAPAAAYVPIMWGVDNGYYEDVGLEARTEMAPGGAALVPAMQAGSVQIGGSNLMSVLQAQEKGLDMKCISGAYRSNTSALMGSPATGRDIETGADLEGKTVGINAVGSANQLIVSKWVDDNGGDSSKVNFIAVGFPDQASALEAGQIDAAIADEPFTTQMITLDFPVIDDDPPAVLGTDVTFGCWIVLNEWLQGHEAEIEAFSAATAKLNQHFLDNPDLFREQLVQYLDVSEEAAAKVVLPEVTTDLTFEDLEAWQNPSVEYGFLQAPINLEIIDGGFTDQK